VKITLIVLVEELDVGGVCTPRKKDLRVDEYEA